jgi:hypothetical protein
VSDITERDYRRNLALLATDYTSFGVGLTFLGPTTVLPNLVRLLGGSPLAVGSLGVIQMGGWILPQFFMGRYVANRPLVKKYVVWPGIASRALLALALPALALFGVRAPHLALAVFLLTFAGFTVCDALGGIGWFDLVAKTVPLELRGRAMGLAQTLYSLAAIAVGVAVTAILARPDPFPANYLLLIALAVAFMGISPVAIGLMREPAGVSQGETQPSWREYLPRLMAILRGDARFLWLTVAGWVATLADMGGAFYVLYAADRLHIAQPTIGLFISAGVVGGLLSGVILGPLGDRRGSAAVIAVTMALRCLCPGLALLTPLLAGLYAGLGPAVFVVIFAALGMVGGAYMIGFTNYLLEIAPAGERSLYIALSHTMGIVVMFAPLLAGWVVGAVSYEALFVITLTLAILGLLVALRGPEPAAKPVAA